MSGVALLLRGLSGLALPALAVVTWRRRARSETPAAGAPAVETPETPLLRRPTRAELSGMLEDGRDLSRLDLSGLKLKGARLSGRSLTGSDLSRSRLAGARLEGADLSGAILDFADLTRSDLRRADLSNTSMLETTFWDADLSGADLTGAKNIIMANMRRARYDRHTRWPPRLDPTSLGARPVDPKSQ